MSFKPECYVVLNLVMQKILDTCWEYLQAQDGDDFRVFYLNYHYVLILTSFYF